MSFDQNSNPDVQRFVDEIIGKWLEDKDIETPGITDSIPVMEEVLKMAFQALRIQKIYFVSAGHADEYGHFAFSTQEKADKFLEKNKPETYGYRMDIKEVDLDSEQII